MKILFLIIGFMLITNLMFPQGIDSTYIISDIHGDQIVLLPDAKIFVEAKLNENKTFTFKIVNEIKDSLKTIVISFGEKDFGGHNSTILNISNPFDADLFYKAYISRKVGTFKETDVAPIFSHISSMEMWPYKIQCIKLSEFNLILSKSN
jgi:hypothetical protein